VAATRDADAAGQSDRSPLTDTDRAGLLEYMMLMRAVEEEGLRLYKQGKVPGSFYDGRGQEAVCVGATWALHGSDPISSPLIRDLGAHLVRGTDLVELFRHYMGRSNTISRGREGNVHFGDRTKGIVGMISMLPDMMVVAVGFAMAFRMRGERRCALTFFGDGATSRGDWHEAMNWAGIDQLPVIFVFENNQTAYSTPTSRQFAVDPVDRAAGYGVHAITIDGNDVEAVFAATSAARTRAVEGGGPTLIETQTMRMHGHGAHDDAGYMEKDVLEKWAARDPINSYAERLRADRVDVDAIQARVTETVSEAVDAAMTGPMPEPSEALGDVFCQGEAEPIGEGPTRWSGFAQEVTK